MAFNINLQNHIVAVAVSIFFQQYVDPLQIGRQCGVVRYPGAEVKAARVSNWRMRDGMIILEDKCAAIRHFAVPRYVWPDAKGIADPDRVQIVEHHISAVHEPAYSAFRDIDNG